MASRKPARTPPRKRRKKPPAKGGLGLPVLEQHHRDLIGLGLVAFAAFLAFVLYLGAAGGRVGDAVEEGLRFLMGGAAVLAPPALCATGVVLVLHDSLPSVKPFRAGAICLLLGVTLGLAAGTLGLGPGAHDHAPLLDPGYVSDRGGALGELLYAASSQLFSELGSHIIFLFLVTGGVLLLTGASIAGVVARTRDGVNATTERVKRSTSELTAVLRAPDATGGQVPRVAPPEPRGVDPVVHATHVEAPALDAESRYPDLFGDEPETEEPDEQIEPEEPVVPGAVEEEPGVVAEDDAEPLRQSRSSSPRWATAAPRSPRPRTWTTRCPSPPS